TRFAGNKAIAFYIRTNATHLQNWSYGEKMTDSKPDGFLHFGLNRIRNQDYVERARMARLLHVLKTEGRIYSIASTLQPFHTKTQSGFCGHDQQEGGCWDWVHKSFLFPLLRDCSNSNPPLATGTMGSPLVLYFQQLTTCSARLQIRNSNSQTSRIIERHVHIKMISLEEPKMRAQKIHW